MLEIADFWRKN